MTGFATNFRLHAVFFRTLFTFVCKSFGLLFSDVLIFYLHCLLFSCIQLNSASLYFTVCIRPIRLRRNIPPQASLQLSFLLFRQCSLFIKISFCMKFSRYKSYPLRGTFRNPFGISDFIDCLFHQSLEISILMNLWFYETFGSMKSLITGKTVLLLFYSGSHLLSHAVSNIVSSAA